MKVVIAGGGIAGLSAGIYAQMAGFDSEIYEKNPIAGGQCTGWNRKGCHIDNCIHWLTGTGKGTGLRTLWEEIGALNQNTKLIQLDCFYSSEKDGKTVTMWRDLSRTEREMLELAPEDEEEIRRFIRSVRLAECCEMPVEKPMEKMNLIDYGKLGKKMSGMVEISKEYGKNDIEDLGKRFKNPVIREAITGYMPKEYYATAFLVSYATFTSGNGDIPAGGSLAMAKRIVKRYQQLGGRLYTNSEVKKVRIDGNKAAGILLSNGAEIDADFVILAPDASESFGRLLGLKYMDKKWKKCYENGEIYPVTSGLQMAFSAPKEECKEIGCHFFECEPLETGHQKIHRLSVKNYAYEKSFAPEGRTVLQTNILQYAEDFSYWKGLDKEEYHQKKLELSEEVQNRIIKRYPALAGKLEFLDCWTPVTYENYCRSYKGAYMSFIPRKGMKPFQSKGRLKGLKNVLLATQWNNAPGGLPCAAAAGKFAIARMHI